MGNVALFSAWSPHHEKRDAVEHSDTLIPPFAIGFPRILAGQQIAGKEIVQIKKVDAVVLEIAATFGFVPSVHITSVYASAYTDKQQQRPGRKAKNEAACTLGFPSY